jgi:hypothetical protein
MIPSTSCTLKLVASTMTIFLLMMVARLLAQPPDNGTLGECAKDKDGNLLGTTYPPPRFCEISAKQSCASEGCFAKTHKCNPQGGCLASGCTHFRRSNVVSYGACQPYEPATPPGSTCFRCSWFACAEGTMFRNSTECENELNQQCAAIFWRDLACDPQP